MKTQILSKTFGNFDAASRFARQVSARSNVSVRLSFDGETGYWRAIYVDGSSAPAAETQKSQQDAPGAVDARSRTKPITETPRKGEWSDHIEFCAEEATADNEKGSPWYEEHYLSTRHIRSQMFRYQDLCNACDRPVEYCACGG
jgi:hypothetical protein